MCGIFCLLQSGADKSTIQPIIDVCQEAIQRRGPDSFKQLAISEDCATCTFLASVRWTQGVTISPQPLEDVDGNVLLWNGDVYNFTSEDNKTIESTSESDSLQVLQRFASHGVLKTLKHIQGPYSFIFLDKKNKQLWFGKDPIGRHSLLLKCTPTSILVTSVAHKSIPHIEEISNTHIYSVDITCPDFQLGLKEHKWKRNISICPILKSYHPKEPSTDPTPPEEVVDFFANVNITAGGDKAVLMKTLDTYPLFCDNVAELTKLLTQSVEKRVRTQPSHCVQCVEPCGHCKTGVLFSGGIDSTVIALLANQFVPSSEPIDLLNVAFEKNQNYNVPDRLTGLSSLQELTTLCPDRQWNFVEINISRRELEDQRHCHIKDVIYPLDTVLDDSLGCAVWFAARGVGRLGSCGYTSSARVLLLGMGADELLGGYTRHRTILRHCGNDWSALRAQLEHEVLNISRRNLGRDNRVVCDHGRQSRTPFLDEPVVAFLLSLPSWQRCWITDDLPPSVGDKLLLRLLAWKLGLKVAASLPKRALQFGSRIANSREKGNAVCVRLQS
ncbi:hypothetical protein M8J77_011885 [Diaphorina citri]|nr:hypothetical protein M8J77_011885 [Diaphorina citri]